MAPTRRPPGLWKRAVAWLLLLGPLFFATYGFATWMTARRPSVGSVVFDWEHAIPLWPWTIVPYWSIDLLYGFSLLVCTRARELDNHARRLLTAQAIAVSCFLLFPLRFTFERPRLDGAFGLLFDILMGFDKPFNQAPSLHITLLVVLWVCYAAHARGIWKWLVHGWFSLIGLSVLTTWQHHFIDLPTGILAGWLCVWLWPADRPSPLRTAHLAADGQRRKLALAYLGGALLCALPTWLGGYWLWFAWPAISLLMVALNYALLGGAGFQKQADGALSLAARWLMAPYLLAARANAWLWTRAAPEPGEIVDGVWLGRLPARAELAAANYAGIVDLSAELAMPAHDKAYRSLPVLDLTSPDLQTCRAAAGAIETLRAHGPVLVCCALGYSRSATAVAAWLLLTGRASSVDAALATITRKRRHVLAGPAQRDVLASLGGALSMTPTTRPFHAV